MFKALICSTYDRAVCVRAHAYVCVGAWRTCVCMCVSSRALLFVFRHAVQCLRVLSSHIGYSNGLCSNRYQVTIPVQVYSPSHPYPDGLRVLVSMFSSLDHGMCWNSEGFLFYIHFQQVHVKERTATINRCLLATVYPQIQPNWEIS